MNMRLSLDSLKKQGFDLSNREGASIYKVRCSQCEALVINNIPTHEQACPNKKRPKR